MRLLPKFLRRDTPATPNPADDRWYSPILNLLGRSRTTTPESMLACSTFVSCVQVLAKTFAALPLNVYEKSADSAVRTKATDHPLYRMLHDSPAPWLTSFEFREMLMFHLFMRGNFYAQKVRNKGGSLSFLMPLDPARMKPMLRDNGATVYTFRTSSGALRVFDAEEIFHVKFISLNGVEGVSPITYAANVIPFSHCLEEFSIRFFENNASPSGALEHPQKLGDKAYNKLKESWANLHQGVENAHRVAILEDGMKFTAISMSNLDAQHIENRKYSRVEICGLCGVPPHMIQDLERATFTNIEHQDLAFGKHTIVPLCERVEQAIHLRLFEEVERDKYFAEFLLEGLLRGDFKTRQEGFQVMRLNGVINADEWRAKENLAPLGSEQGKIYIVPSNMMNLEHAKDQGPSSPVGGDKADPAKAPADDTKEQVRQVISKAFENLFADRVVHISTKEGKAIESIRSKPDPAAAFSEFISAHDSFLRNNLRALFEQVAFLSDHLGIKFNHTEALNRCVVERLTQLRLVFSDNAALPGQRTASIQELISLE